MLKTWAIKYLDENGNTEGYGYGQTVENYKAGDVIKRDLGGSILLEFEMRPEDCFK